jgi:SagB-type dehydrogenase family enzyme
MKNPPDPVEVVLAYHEETKHHFHRFARSLGYLDWETQPDPFREFADAPLARLPLLTLAESPSYVEAVAGRAQAQPLTLNSLSRFFRNSMAISAWKRYGESHWALRVNPSSGNLHPTESYAILPGIEGEFTAGVYHYRPRDHALEQRAALTPAVFQNLLADFPEGAFLAGLSSIHWREAWKYGERAYRYCEHDTGHALGALRVSAIILGWQLIWLDELSDADIATLLGLNRPPDFEEAEDEDPDLIAVVIPSAAPLLRERALQDGAIAAVRDSRWKGRANRLSLSHVEWDIIPQAAKAGIKPRTAIADRSPSTIPSPGWTANPVAGAEQIVQQRRSAVDLDGETSISADAFYHILERALPERNPAFFAALRRSPLSTPRIHFGLYVHRIEGLQPGLYFLLRDPSQLVVLKSTTNPEFEWKPPEGCPAHLPLYRLKTHDVRRISAGVSCGQDIAGNGAFSLGMIAEFEEPIRSTGAWLYRRLFWESGFVGQILYLEAEAAGIRATGMGCYFDDPVHETFGFKGRRFQSLYHFTMGGPVDDTRITTEPAYDLPVR